jgi:hypothetical protein
MRRSTTHTRRSDLKMRLFVVMAASSPSEALATVPRCWRARARGICHVRDGQLSLGPRHKGIGLDPGDHKAAAAALGRGEARSLPSLVHMAVSAAENEGGTRI